MSYCNTKHILIVINCVFRFALTWFGIDIACLLLDANSDCNIY